MDWNIARAFRRVSIFECCLYGLFWGMLIGFLDIFIFAKTSLWFLLPFVTGYNYIFRCD